MAGVRYPVMSAEKSKPLHAGVTVKFCQFIFYNYGVDYSIGVPYINIAPHWNNFKLL